MPEEELDRSVNRISTEMTSRLKIEPGPMDQKAQFAMRGQFSESPEKNVPIDTISKRPSRRDSPPVYEILMEKLPGYTCSVHHEGFMHRKIEFTSNGSIANDRSWRKCYCILWGTSLQLYKYKPTQFYRPDPFESISMQRAKVDLAADYRKRCHVFRLQTRAGQFLLQANSRNDLLKWLNFIQASANIALPLESRVI
ncbi:PH domain-like protein [Basidiobolus meristosporus CBS 931.73]|uniref:PH domain-like protein n=1 Tax=Basidiobolus meristosporus CBS 931.73 TaxID=1314790 RepID=A0A1Y1XY20_9FUNG|nr:PH domain-like protein [Basidiobolus meristosporus CBS 931.73]|eukprot:ORX90629.1 PH domain-like protein [Basidiobolus meristosporus CBS 931.73]